MSTTGPPPKAATNLGAVGGQAPDRQVLRPVRLSHEPKRWYGGDYDDMVVATAEGWRFSTCTGRWLLTLDEEDLPEHGRTW